MSTQREAPGPRPCVLAPHPVSCSQAWSLSPWATAPLSPPLAAAQAALPLLHRCRIPSTHTYTRTSRGLADMVPASVPGLGQRAASSTDKRQSPSRSHQTPQKRGPPPTLLAGAPLTRQAGLEPQQEQRAAPAPLTWSTVLGPRSSRGAPPAAGTERTTAPALTTSIKTQDTVGRPQTARRRPEQRGYAARLDSSGEKYIDFMLSNIIVIHLFSRQSF